MVSMFRLERSWFWLPWAATTVTKGRVETFLKLGVVPTGVDSQVAEIMHRTTYGVDADPANLLLGGVRCALADYAACHQATDLADILFGTPKPVVSRACLGVLKKDAVNIALHGHNPLLSDMVVQVAGDEDLVAKVALQARLVPAERGLRQSRPASVASLLRGHASFDFACEMAQALPLRRVVLHYRLGLPRLGRSAAVVRLLDVAEAACGRLLPRARWSYMVFSGRKPGQG